MSAAVDETEWSDFDRRFAAAMRRLVAEGRPLRRVTPPSPPSPAPKAPPRTRMLPVLGERLEDCTRSGECIGAIARAYPDARGASCPPACPAYEPIRKLERDVFAGERPGDNF